MELSLGDKIKSLRAIGKTYPEIQAELGCSKSTISYYLSAGGKDRVRERTRKRRQADALQRRVEVFKEYPAGKDEPVESTSSSAKSLRARMQKFHKLPDGTEPPVSTFNFSARDVREKFGDSPICYLTGDTLDYEDMSNLSFDHVFPRSRGGENSLENLGLTTKMANRMKANQTLDELLEMCEKILKHHGRI